MNLLVVDDDRLLLKFLKIHLSNVFRQVIVVPRAFQALKVLENHEIDLVISDFEMPKWNGLWLLDHVKSHDPSIPFLLISGAWASFDAETEKRILKGVDGHMRKPIEIEDLCDLIMQGVAIRRANLKRQKQKAKAGVVCLSERRQAKERLQSQSAVSAHKKKATKPLKAKA